MTVRLSNMRRLALAAAVIVTSFSAPARAQQSLIIGNDRGGVNGSKSPRN